MRKIERELKNNISFYYVNGLPQKKYDVEKFNYIERYNLWEIINKILQKVKNFDQYFNIKITTDDRKVYTIINNNNDVLILDGTVNIDLNDSKTYIIRNFKNNNDFGTIEISKAHQRCIINNKPIISIDKTIKFKWVDNHVNIRED